MADSREKSSMLHQAIHDDQHILVTKLLKEGVEVDCRDINSSTPLHIAAETSNVNIAQILLEFQADINAKDKYGRTTLDTAFWNGNEEFITALLDRTSDINIPTNNRDDTPLHLAVELSTPELVNWLLEKGANVNAKKYRGKTPLHLAAKRGCSQMIRSLLRYGADYNCIDEDGNTALIIASREAKEEVVHELLQYNVDVNVRVRKGETALHLLIENKVHSDTVGLLLKKGALINTGSIINRTPLHICAIYGQSDTAELLLQFNADPNLRDTNDQTPLHLACTQGNEGVIKVLLKYSADLGIQNELGKTPLHYAAVFGCSTIVKLLLDHGADPNAKNIDGRTPLVYSVCETYNIEVVKMLLEHGAEINCIDRYGLTPLHIASRVAGKEMVSGLLNLGANINARDWENRTPLHVAILNSDQNRGTRFVLEKHIIMRKVAGLPICQENLCLMETDDELDEFEMSCRNELNKMKETKIGRSTISYHDVLIKAIDELVKFVNNKNVQKELSATEYKSKFPLYAEMVRPIINKNFKKARDRRKLIDRSVELFQVACGNFPELPPHFINNVFMYLSNYEMQNWIAAF